VFFSVFGVAIALFALSILAAHYFEQKQDPFFNQVDRVKKLILWNQKHLKKIFLLETKKENLEKSWEERYASIPVEKLPWNIGKASEQIVQLIDKGKVDPCIALDLGCGLGNDTLFLATMGFEVTGIDVSKTAIEYARERAKDTKCTFVEGDVLKMKLPKENFEFVNDRGCFHNIDVNDRERFVRELARVMKPGAKYFMLTLCNKAIVDSKAQNTVSRDEIENVFSKDFKMIYIRETKLIHNVSSLKKGYECFMERK